MENEKTIVIIVIVIFIIIVKTIFEYMIKTVTKYSSIKEFMQNDLVKKVCEYLFLSFLFIAFIVALLYFRSSMISKKISMKLSNLSSSNDYIIIDDKFASSEENYYYYIDFEKDRSFYKMQEKGSKKVRAGIINKYGTKEIEEIILNVMSDEENLKEITPAEQNKLLSNSIYGVYTIKTYNGKLYYIKDLETAKRVKEILFDSIWYY